jgi:hypothetical protein
MRQPYAADRDRHRRDKGQGQKHPETRYPEVAHGLPPPVGSLQLDTPQYTPVVAPRLPNRPSADVAGGREDGWILRVGAWALRSSS